MMREWGREDDNHDDDGKSLLTGHDDYDDDNDDGDDDDDDGDYTGICGQRQQSMARTPGGWEEPIGLP